MLNYVENKFRKSLNYSNLNMKLLKIDLSDYSHFVCLNHKIQLYVLLVIVEILTLNLFVSLLYH